MKIRVDISPIRTCLIEADEFDINPDDGFLYLYKDQKLIAAFREWMMVFQDGGELIG